MVAVSGFVHNRRGSVALMFALMLPIIFGIIGLGVEVGMWFKDRRELQTIADAAAVSAAIENAYGATQAEIEAAAQMEATTNGFDATTDDITYIGVPTQGAFNGQAGYIEVIISRQLETILSQVFSSLDPTTTVRAVASTGNASSGEACVLALDTTGAAVTVSGNGAVTLTNCQVASNSTADDALSVSGSGGLDVDCYSVVGNVDVSAGLTTAAGCAGATGATAIADPYADLEDPDDGNCDEPGNFEWNSVGSTTIGNGSWNDPYVICGDFWAKKGTVTFNGLVVIKGDFKANATATIDSAANGTTVVLKDGGQINNINGGADVTLTAPSSEAIADEWQGILFYQDRDTSPACTGNNCNTLNGNGSTMFEGVVYFPNQELDTLGGNSSTSACLQIVALRVGFSGNGAMNADNDCLDAGVDPIEVPGPYTSLLVE
ncbi:MAG: pilus assembly protein TadG-related protein [Rhodospirillales bacterium]|nr:pilus assembly protein TadG-related protein [Rhodospirillales bacterium]